MQNQRQACVGVLVVLATAGVAHGQFGPPNGGGAPPAGPGAAVRAGAGQQITGEILEVADGVLTIQLAGAPTRGGQPEPGREVRVVVNDGTRYRILEESDEDAVEADMLLAAVGPEDGQDDEILAKAMAVYRADDEPSRILPLFAGLARHLVVASGMVLGREVRPEFVFGHVDTPAPLTIKAMGREEARLVDVEMDADLRVFTVDEMEPDDLEVGQWAVVVPVRQAGRGRPGEAAAEPVAAYVMQTPPLPQNGFAGRAQARPGDRPPAQ